MAVATKQHNTSITKEATTTAPGAFNLSNNQSKPGAAVLLNAIAAITNTTAAATNLTIGAISKVPPAARATTTARITIPKISSRTAAPITICPSLVFKYPNSPKTLAVIPILVAVIDAPAKTAGIRSTWKININPRVPNANGKITPAIATVKA